MKKIKYVLICIFIAFFCYKTNSQTAYAIPGKNGIFINFGKELPKDFKYMLERRKNGEKENWQLIYTSAFPQNAEILKGKIQQINSKNPFYKFPDSTELAWFFKKIQKYRTSDSVSFYNYNPQYIEAMGTGYFDTEIKPGQKYEYKVSIAGKTTQKPNSQELKPEQFPGKTPEWSIKYLNTSVQENRIVHKYYIKGENKPFGVRVFRQYTLQSPFKEINPAVRSLYNNDSLFLYIIDKEVAKKLIYRYFIQPYDMYGNTGAISDTIQVSNVKQYNETPLLSYFKSSSLDQEKTIKLSWRFPDIKNLRGISIYRSLTFDSGYVHLADVPAKDTTYLDTKIKPVKTYYYFLVIHGAYGDSPPTTKVSGMLNTGFKPVTPPQDIMVEKVPGGNKISWRKFDRGTIGYYLYRGQGYRTELMEQCSDIIRSDSVYVSYVDSSKYLKKGEAYCYAVASVNINNMKSPISNKVVANPEKPELPTPLNLQIRKNPNGALLIWEDMTKISTYIIGYQVYRTSFDDQGKVIEKTKVMNLEQPFSAANSFLDTSFHRGIKYTYAIKAIGIENSESSKGQEISFYIPKILPHPPSGLRAFVIGEGVMLQWDTPLAEKIKSYKVYREESGKKAKLVAELENSTTTYLDKLPQKSKSYFYTLSVVNSEGIESIKSDEAGVNY